MYVKRLRTRVSNYFTLRSPYVRFCYFNVNVANLIRAYKDSKPKHVVTVIPKGE